MIWLIIAAIVVAAVTIYRTVQEFLIKETTEMGDWDWQKSTFKTEVIKRGLGFRTACAFMAFIITLGMSILITAVPLLVVNFIAAQIVNDTKWELAYDRPLNNLADNSGITGSFFLGSGYIGSDQYFSYYSKAASGNYKLSTQPAKWSEIKLSNTERPSVKRYNPTSVNEFWTFFGDDGDPKFIFTIPDGSIKQVYNLDAE